MAVKANTSVAALAKYNVPTLPQIQGGDQIFWRNELGKLSKAINLLVANGPGITQVGDANYTIQVSDRTINGTTTFTAPRTWTLPPVSSVLPGVQINLIGIPAALGAPWTLQIQGTDQLYDIDQINPGSLTQLTFPCTVSLLLWAVPDTNGNFWCYKLLGSASSSLIAGSRLLAPVSPPQGRLSPSSTTAVVNSNTSSSTVYWVPYIGRSAPLWNGETWVMYDIGEVSIANSDTTNAPAATVAQTPYDYFIWLKNGVPTLSRGPAWTNATTRSVVVGRSAGFQVNTGTYTNGPPANYGLYVGSVYMDGSNNASMLFGGAGSGGAFISFLVWNMYNRVELVGNGIDNGTAYTYNSTTPRVARASNANAFYYMDGMGEDGIMVTYKAGLLVAAAGGSYTSNALARDTSGSSYDFWTQQYFQSNGGAQAAAVPLMLASAYEPALGFHSISPMEWDDGTSGTVHDRDNNNTLTVRWRC